MEGEVTRNGLQSMNDNKFCGKYLKVSCFPVALIMGITKRPFPKLKNRSLESNTTKSQQD